MHFFLRLACACVLVTLLLPKAAAADPRDRDGWYLGLGFGPAWGQAFLAGDDDPWLSERGSSPQVRGGRMMSPHAAIGLEAQTWFIEGGTVGDEVMLQVKGRFTSHLWALAGTWYPGGTGFWKGAWVRAGVGPAIANYAVAIPDPDDPESGQERQVRIDEWGWGVVAAVGYEARVAPHFAVGVQVAFSSVWIDEMIDRVRFGGPVLHLQWYF